MSSYPVRLAPVFHERVWGSFDLDPWFARPDRKIGEVWFQDEPASPLLIKFLFTTEKLSIQVHPDDAQALAMGFPRGKTEMWHVLRAGAGASLGLGFRESVDAARLRAAALNGEIEQLMSWRAAAAGETYYVPAGTVHAIGPNLAICEIQQNSDVTFRLYDYGRPRELHLDAGIAVAHGGVYDDCVGRSPEAMIQSPFFSVRRVALDGHSRISPSETEWWVTLAGDGQLGGRPYRLGECWRLGAEVLIEPAQPSVFLRVRAGLGS